MLNTALELKNISAGIRIMQAEELRTRLQVAIDQAFERGDQDALSLVMGIIADARVHAMEMLAMLRK